MDYPFWVCQWVLRTLLCIFWMRLYFKTWSILMIFLFWETPRLFGHFVLMCSSSTFLSHMDNTFFSSFLYILAGFNKIVIMQVCGDIMGLGSWEFFQDPLVRHQAQLPISFGGIGIFSMEDLCPICFFKELGSSSFVFVL
jgi:hypothetical protein